MARNYSSIAEVKTLAANVPLSGLNSDKVTVKPNIDGFPTVPFVLVLNPDTSNEEAVLATSLSGSTYTVTRNIEGGGIKSHTIDQTVKHMIVGSDLQIVHDHFSNNNTTTGTAHGAVGGVVGRTNDQVLTTKTINLANNTLIGTTAQFNNALSDADFATTALLEARVPVGAVNMWVTGTAPSGWLLCQGQQVAVADYSTLASVLGVTYGALTNGSGGAGTTHFRLPDLRGRAPMGAGTGNKYDGSKADIGDLTTRTLGDYVSNEEAVTLTAAQSGVPSHTHPVSISDPGHGHSFGPGTVFSKENANWGSRYGAPETGVRLDQPTYVYPNTTGITASATGNTTAAASEAHNNVQPSIVINFIIKH